MCSQEFYLHTHTLIRNRNEPYLPLPSQPQLVLIYRPRRNGRLSRPWCKVAPAEIRTCNLPIANPALYHTATSAPRVFSWNQNQGQLLFCSIPFYRVTAFLGTPVLRPRRDFLAHCIAQWICGMCSWWSVGDCAVGWPKQWVLQRKALCSID